MITLSDEDLKYFHSGTLETAQEILSEKGQVTAVAFVLARKMGIDSFIRGRSVRMEDWRPVEDDGTTPTELVCVTIPLSYTDPVVLIDQVKYLSDDPAAAEATFQTLIAAAPSFGVADPLQSMLRAVLKYLGTTNAKDITSAFLRKLCHNADAEAIVKVEEVWLGDPSRPPRNGGSLEDDPHSTEALMSVLETKSFVRMLIKHFTRESRGGKFLAFGKTDERIDDFSTSGDTRLEGRFIGLLPGYPQRTAAR